MSGKKPLRTPEQDVYLRGVYAGQTGEPPFKYPKGFTKPQMDAWSFGHADALVVNLTTGHLVEVELPEDSECNPRFDDFIVRVREFGTTLKSSRFQDPDGAYKELEKLAKVEQVDLIRLRIRQGSEENPTRTSMTQYDLPTLWKKLHGGLPPM